MSGRRERKNWKRQLWKILEAYGCLDHFKCEYMQEVRNDMFKELVKLYENKKTI